MDMLWFALFAIVLACTLAASIRLAFVGLGHLPTSPIMRFLTNDYWVATLLVVVPMYAGGFARREDSPLPWRAFSNAAARNGILDGLSVLVIVLIVELWLLFIPAQSYILNRPELDRRTIILVRCLNLAIGLLLLTPQNPIYELLMLLPKSDSDSYGP